MERRDPYRILQVQPDADVDVVRAAYRVLARKVHPDASAPMDELEERRMTDLNWAYAIVRDEGWTLGEVAKRDPDYLDWLRRHASGARYRDVIDILLRKYRPRSSP